MTYPCKGSKHTLIEIYRCGNDMVEDVVRWCKNCGAIVVDTDFDNRTAAGDVMKMKHPQLVYDLLKKRN